MPFVLTSRKRLFTWKTRQIGEQMNKLKMNKKSSKKNDNKIMRKVVKSALEI